MPADAAQLERLEAVLGRFGESLPATHGAAAVRLDDGTEELAAVIRELDREGVTVGDLKLHAPSLDDVFLAKTGRSLEGAGVEEEEVEPESREHVREPV